MWVQYRKSELEADKMIYHEESVNVEHTLISAKSHYENKPVNQIREYPKICWNYTRHLSRSSSTVDMLKIQGKKVTEDTEKANILKKYFILVLIEEPDILNSRCSRCKSTTYTRRFYYYFRHRLEEAPTPLG